LALIIYHADFPRANTLVDADKTFVDTILRPVIEQAGDKKIIAWRPDDRCRKTPMLSQPNPQMRLTRRHRLMRLWRQSNGWAGDIRGGAASDSCQRERR